MCEWERGVEAAEEPQQSRRALLGGGLGGGQVPGPVLPAGQQLRAHLRLRLWLSL